MSLFLSKLLPAFILAVAFLWVASSPVFANWAIGRLEATYPPVAAMEDVPKADAIILLGGKSPARILTAGVLYRAQKADLIVITGGNLPWSARLVPEAEEMAELLVGLGVPRQALVLDAASRNTRENALNTAAIFRSHGLTSGLLVTSGAHMPRALAVFRQAGLQATPVATDLRAERYEGFLDLLPDAMALEKTTTAVKEWIGLAAYRVRGWA
jgi:uncharacterized SAM-binding protein YcdF (DUF218 family)